MKTEKRQYIYVNITKQSIALVLIADLLKLSKYMLFLQYEVFGNDLFLIFDMFMKAGLLPTLTSFRLKRCFVHADALYKVFSGEQDAQLSITMKRSLQIVNALVYETKLRVPVDQEAFD